MDFTLSPDHLALRQRTRAFARDVIRPVIRTLDEERIFPAEHLPLLAREGFLSLHWPKEAGGAGHDTLAYALVIEELSRVSPAHGITVSAHVSLVGTPLVAFGTPEQKTAWLPRLASGECLGGLAMTEAQAGSDVGAIALTALREDGGFVLNGEKVMVTNGGPAGLFLVLASTDPGRGIRGLSAFLVAGDAPGLTRGPRGRTMGLRPADVRTLRFENVRVPQGGLLGPEGHGMKVALEGLNVGRIGVAAQALGIAVECRDLAVGHARRREQFGQPIARFGGVGERIAAMAVDADVARLLTWQAALARDRGEDFSAHAARAKWTASEAAVRAADHCLQIHGGLGFYEATGVERYYRDAKVTELYEGTTEMQKTIVARSVVAG